MDEAEKPVEQVAEAKDPRAEDAASRGMPETSEGESSNVTPEEQAMYDAVVTAARGIIFDDARFKIVLDKLAGGKDELASTLGHTAAMVMISVQGGIEKQGRTVPGDIMLHAGTEILDDLIEIAMRMKLMDESQREEVTKKALFEGMKVFGDGEISKGLTPEKQAAAQQEAAAIKGQQSGLVSSRMGA